jgi:hypothetical protein
MVIYSSKSRPDARLAHFNLTERRPSGAFPVCSLSPTRFAHAVQIRLGSLHQRHGRVGFMARISKAEFLKTKPLTETWSRSMNGRWVTWKNHRQAPRPRLLVDGAKSVISLLLNYHPRPKPKQPDDTLKISKYAYGRLPLRHQRQARCWPTWAEIGAIGGRCRGPRR